MSFDDYRLESGPRERTGDGEADDPGTHHHAVETIQPWLP
jgi:hypothetical protein